jgi:hypothetical protein
VIALIIALKQITLTASAIPGRNVTPVTKAGALPAWTLHISHWLLAPLHVCADRERIAPPVSPRDVLHARIRCGKLKMVLLTVSVYQGSNVYSATELSVVLV